MNNIQEIIEFGKKIDKNRYSPGSSGNISIKENKFIFITRSGTDLGNLTEDDIVFLKSEEEFFHLKRRGEGVSPSIETKLHIKTYQKTKSKVIIHTHPTYSRLISLTKNKLELTDEEKKAINLEEIPIIKNYKAGTDTLAKETSKKLEKNKAIIVKNHGLFVRSKKLRNAFKTTSIIEEAAKIKYKKN